MLSVEHKLPVYFIIITPATMIVNKLGDKIVEGDSYMTNNTSPFDHSSLMKATLLRPAQNPKLQCNTSLTMIH